jgi:hypothetical protein
MPRAAIETGMVDRVLAPEEIGTLLKSLDVGTAPIPGASGTRQEEASR